MGAVTLEIHRTRSMKPPIYDPFWSDEVKALYAHDMQEMWDPSINRHVFNMYHDELKRYLDLAGSRSLRILDVGCAQGTLALLLAEAGHHVTALDLRPAYLEYARSRYEKGSITFVEGNVLELDLAGPYDLIYANQLLEHLVYPVEMMAGLANLLAPGGRLIATTPSGHYLKSTLPSFTELGDPEQYADRQFFPDGDGHFFAYLPDELKSIAQRAGLADVRVITYASPWITGHMKLRFLHGIVPVPVLRLLDRGTLMIPFLKAKFGYQLMVSGRRAV